MSFNLDLLFKRQLNPEELLIYFEEWRDVESLENLSILY